MTKATSHLQKHFMATLWNNSRLVEHDVLWTLHQTIGCTKMRFFNGIKTPITEHGPAADLPDRIALVNDQHVAQQKKADSLEFENTQLAAQFQTEGMVHCTLRIGKHYGF